jgi:hypothetical protein
MAANPLLLESIAIFGATALGAGIILVAALALWRAMSDERPLLLAEVLAFEGIDMAKHVKGAGAMQFAVAARRCMDCGARGRCEAWVAGRSGAGYERFCPNAGYVARLKRADL